MFTGKLLTISLVILVSSLIALPALIRAEEVIREVVVDAKWGDGPGEVGIRGDGVKAGPNDFTIDDNGNIYVMDTVNNRVNKYDFKGTFLFSIDVGSSNLYVDVDCNGERIYVAGSSNDPVKAFDREGKLLWQVNVTRELGKVGRMVTQIDNISAGEDGNVYLFYNGYTEVCRISRIGQILSTFLKREDGRIVWRSPRKACAVRKENSRRVNISVGSSEGGPWEKSFNVITDREIPKSDNVTVEMIDKEGNLYALYGTDKPDGGMQFNIIKVTPNGNKAFEVSINATSPKPLVYYYSNGSLRISKSGDIYNMYSDKDHFWIEKISVRY